MRVIDDMTHSDFHFQKFSVRHTYSAMKVGIDSILLGGWAPFEKPMTALDIGTGCGILSLMMAQRFPAADILGVDIDPVACEEAKGNFNRSPWPDRLKAMQGDVLNLPAIYSGRFDAIISNPPFFTDGLMSRDIRKSTARHQKTLSTTTFLKLADSLLSSTGTAALILPYDHLPRVQSDLEDVALFIDHLVLVKPLATKPPHRIMLHLRKIAGDVKEYEVVLGPPQLRSEDFQKITNPFYRPSQSKKGR